MATDPYNDSVFWCGGQNVISYGYEMSVSKTTDYGSNWTRYTLSPEIGYAYSLAIDPLDPDIIYAGGCPRLYKTIDGGINWSTSEIDTTLALAVNPQQTNIIYAGTSVGVLKSINSGVDWNNTGLSNRINEILLDPYDPNIIYAATAAGVYRSTQGGGNWEIMNDGLQNTIVWTLAINPGNYLYAGTDSAGVFRWLLGPDVEEEDDNNSESAFMIYPNPVKKDLSMCYTLLNRSSVELSVYDIEGRRVRKLVDGIQEAGTHTFKWKGINNEGRRIPNGVYFCRLITDEISAVKKLILIK